MISQLERNKSTSGAGVNCRVFYRISGGKLEQGYGVIEMKEYFLLLDGVFTTNKNVQAPIQKKLKDFYPVLKVTTNKK